MTAVLEARNTSAIQLTVQSLAITLPVDNRRTSVRNRSDEWLAPISSHSVEERQLGNGWLSTKLKFLCLRSVDFVD
jgi:hypothetical protein